MAATTSYIIFLSPPLSTPEQIQDIAQLSQPPEVRPVNEEGSEYEEQDGFEDQPTASTNCCVVDRSTKDAVVEWARSSGVDIKPIIPIIQTESADTANALRASYPVPYFLYGGLTSPNLLQNILELDRPPILQEAAIMGYEIKAWNGRDALVACNKVSSVQGQMYLVTSDAAVEKLADHVGFAFEVTPCQFIDASGENVAGNVFRYRGDRLGLEDLNELMG